MDSGFLIVVGLRVDLTRGYANDTLSKAKGSNMSRHFEYRQNHGRSKNSNDTFNGLREVGEYVVLGSQLNW